MGYFKRRNEKKICVGGYTERPLHWKVKKKKIWLTKKKTQSHNITEWTLFPPTSHMCVENTVLAFMICLLFNLSYKVTITCKWHQLVYFAIITANKPNQPPIVHCISPFVLATKLKMPIFRLKNNCYTKSYTYLSSIFNPNICSKIKSLHLQQTSRSDLGIWLVVSLATFSSRDYTSAILSDPVLRISSCLFHARKEFLEIQP